MRRQIFAPFFCSFMSVFRRSRYINILFLSLPRATLSLSIHVQPAATVPPLPLLLISFSLRFSFHKLCVSVHVSILSSSSLSSTKTLQAVANIVYFAALCQRWMLQAVVILCVRLSLCLRSMFLCSPSSYMCKKMFPTNFLRAFLCSV